MHRCVQYLWDETDVDFIGALSFTNMPDSDCIGVEILISKITVSSSGDDRHIITLSCDAYVLIIIWTLDMLGYCSNTGGHIGWRS